MFQNHLLSIVAYTPLVGAVLLLFINKEHKNFIRWFANVIAAIGFLVSLPLLKHFDVNADGMQFVERHAGTTRRLIGFDEVERFVVRRDLNAIGTLDVWCREDSRDLAGSINAVYNGAGHVSEIKPALSVEGDIIGALQRQTRATLGEDLKLAGT